MPSSFPSSSSSENGAGGPPSTPIRPTADDDDHHHDEDEDDEDCWIPTPPPNNNGGSAYRAKHEASARASSSSDDDGNDRAQPGVPPSHVPAGSLRRRLAATDPPPTNAAAAAAPRPNGHPPRPNAAADSSLLDGLQSTVTPPLLSALLFLTQTSLSTTAHLLAPPLHLTRTVLVPALYYGLADLYDVVTPPRVKDWCAIVTKSAHHLWEVTITSPPGQRWRDTAGRVGGDVVDVMATPATRQAIVETAATMIKVGEALRTPEVRALLDQGAIVGCRLLDAATTGAVQRLVGDAMEMTWAGIEVLASPEAAVGVAECCAYLCRALEGEHGAGGVGRRRRKRRRGRRPAGDIGGRQGEGEGEGRAEDHPHEDRADAARRRRERARRNARLYGAEQGDTIDDGDAPACGGIEEALLASLGDAYRIYERNGGDADGGDDDGASASRHDVDVDVDGTLSLPSRVVVPSPTDGANGGDDELGDGLEPPSTGCGAGTDHANDSCSSIGSGGGDPADDDDDDDGGAPSSSGNASFLATEACDVEWLRRRMSQRARAMEAAQKRHRRRGDGGGGGGGGGGEVVDIEEASSVSEFYRLVEQISSERQAGAVSNILDEEEEERTDAAASNAPSMKRTFYSRAAAAAGAGNERGQDTLQSRLEAYVSRRSRERAGIGVGKARSATPRTSRGILGNNRMVVWILILWFLLGCAVIGGFSCYGIYIFVFAPAAPPTMSSVPLLRRLVGGGRRSTAAASESPTATRPHQSAPVPTEIVVRIVREVVHVTPDVGGETQLDATDNDEADTLALEEKIAEAAVGALQNFDVKTGFLEGEESRPADVSREL